MIGYLKRLFNTKRYFFVSYQANFDSKQLTGNCYFDVSYGDFLNNADVKENINKLHPEIPQTSIVIMNIFEFKSKKDYEDFRIK